MRTSQGVVGKLEELIDGTGKVKSVSARIQLLEWRVSFSPYDHDGGSNQDGEGENAAYDFYST